jgi:tetratricopeptide (TPR) repeat protein
LLAPAVLLLAEINIRKGETTGPIDSLSRLIKANPGAERAYILLGTAYMAAGRLNDAITTYNQALQKFPRNAEAPHLIGVALKQQGRYDEARKVFERIAQANPDDHYTAMELVALDLQAKNTDAAARRIQAWIDKSPNDAAPIFEMAKLRYYLKDSKGAQALLEKVIDMNKDAVAAYVLLGRIYLESNQLDSALQKAKEVLAKQPNDSAALLLSGMIYENKRDYNNARDTYEKLLKVNPQHIVALNNLASLYADRFNDVEKAYPIARKAQELGANNPQFASSVADTFGWVLSLRGEYPPALGLLKDAAQAQPTQPDIQAHLGITQYLAGDEPGARITLENALKLSPSFDRRDQVEKCLAILNINPANADQAAISTLEKRLQENPADAVALARLSAGYEKTGNVDKAIALYEKAVAANPKSAIATARLANLNDQKQNSAKALEFAKNARKLDSIDPEIAHIAGRIATKSTNLQDQQWGLSLLQESSQKNSTNPSVAYDLAWAYYTQGRITEAENSMKTAVASGANQPFAANAKRFLDFIVLSDPARAAQQQPQIDQALQSDPNYLPALAARAAAAQQKGDTAAALKTDDQILDHYPGFAPAARNFVVLSAGQPGDVSKPMAVATRIREQFRDDVDFVKALGILQYQKAEYQTAARTLADIAKKRPNDETVQYYLGMSHYQLKQPKESKVALKKAIDLQPKAPFASEVQKILNEIK